MLVPSPVSYTTNPDPEFVNIWQMVVTLITLQNVFFLTRGLTSETYKTFSFNLGGIYYMSHACKIWLWISFFSHTLALLKNLSGKSKPAQKTNNYWFTWLGQAGGDNSALSLDYWPLAFSCAYSTPQAQLSPARNCCQVGQW